MRTSYFQLKVKKNYQGLIKILLFNPARKRDAFKYFIFWFELTLIGLILFFLKNQNDLFIISFIIILMNLFSIFEKSLNRFAIQFGLSLFLILVNYISLFIIHKTSSLPKIIELQTDYFSIGIPMWGAFLNPFNALIFLILIILTVNGLRPLDPQTINPPLVLKNYLKMMKIFCLSALFIHLFGGGLEGLGDWHQISIDRQWLNILISLLKIFSLFVFFSWINHFLIFMTRKSMMEITLTYLTPLGFISIAFSFLQGAYLV